MRNLTLNAVLAAAATTLAWGSVAQAAEISLLSGLYQSEESESGGANAGGKTTISAGGRFSEQLDGNLFWFAQGGLILRSFKEDAAGNAPSNSTSLNAGGGMRYYFAKLSENVSPFAYGMGEFKSDKDGMGATETEKNGLYYSAAFGIRLGLGTDFFVDFEVPLFESALFATETETTTTAAGKTENETKKTELYVNTTGGLMSCQVALGMRL